MKTPWILAFDAECLHAPERASTIAKRFGGDAVFQGYVPSDGAGPLELHLVKVAGSRMRHTILDLQNEMNPGWFNLMYRPPLNNREGALMAFFNTTPIAISGQFRLRRKDDGEIYLSLKSASEKNLWETWKRLALDQPTMHEDHLDLAKAVNHCEQFRASTLGLGDHSSQGRTLVLPNDFGRLS